jgi:hypothetical protein
MATYALIDEDNVVVQLITGRNEYDVVQGIDSWEDYSSEQSGLRALRTSYNTRGGRHRNPHKEPFRGNYAAIGYIYDEGLDAFIPQKPYPSWVLNTETYNWDAPVPSPQLTEEVEVDFDGVTETVTVIVEYDWDEETQSWIKVLE